MGIKGALWITLIIGLRLFCEDWLVNTQSSPTELLHKLVWWWSVSLAWLTVVSRSTREPIVVQRILLSCQPIILLPPLIDWPQRTSHYPYPNGDAFDCLTWVLNFMPTYVTFGQKVQVTAILVGTLLLVWLQHRLAQAVLATLAVYLMFCLYAWLPALIHACLPWAATHHDVWMLLILGGILICQLRRRF